MNDNSKTKQQLIKELAAIRRRVGQMEESEKIFQQSDDTLRESRELYTKLVDTIPDIIVCTDLEGKILFVNDYTLRISGYSRKEIEGQSMLMFIASEDRDRLLQNALLMMESRLGPKEYQMIMKDGRNIPFEVNGDVLRSGEGQPFGLVFLCREITDRKLANEERYRYEKLHGVLEMAGTVCHELNQPMQIISGYAEMILKNTLENDPIHMKVAKINKQIQRMGTITKKLLRIENYETQDYAGFSRILNINKSSAKDKK